MHFMLPYKIVGVVILINPFPHTTFLRQTILNTSRYQYGTSLLIKLLNRFENIVSKRRLFKIAKMFSKVVCSRVVKLRLNMAIY